MSPPVVTTRAQWDAQYGTGGLDPGPEGNVVIHHSYRPALSQHATVAEEIAAWQSIERFHKEDNGWAGIGYNFGVFPSGRIYEGRGWKYRGAHAGPINSDSIGICLVIDGNVTVPTSRMVFAVRSLIAHGLDLGEIATTYKVSGHLDHMPGRECPGKLVYQMLFEFRHDALDFVDSIPDPEVGMVDSTPGPDLYEDPDIALVSPWLKPVAKVATKHENAGFFGHRVIKGFVESEDVRAVVGPFKVAVMRAVMEWVEEALRDFLKLKREN